MGNSTILENVTPEELDVRIKKAVLDAIASIPEKKEEKFLTRDELAEKLHLTTVTVDKYIRLGKLKAIRIGTRILFKLSEINFDEIPVRKYRK